MPANLALRVSCLTLYAPPSWCVCPAVSTARAATVVQRAGGMCNGPLCGGFSRVCVPSLVKSLAGAGVCMRATSANQALLLINPPSLAYRQIAMLWINLSYCHLQQGLRLLTSNCDFLQLHTTNKCPALFWKNALPALGMIPGIAPNAEQTKSSYTEICASALLIKTKNCTVTIKGNWSLVKLISEPIHYNPNINGRFRVKG